ncbi:MAG: hypothetical protein ACI8Q2_000352, partial [Candidatus Omnitrophota bacterium]
MNSYNVLSKLMNIPSSKNKITLKKEFITYVVAFILLVVFTAFCHVMNYSLAFPLLLVVLGGHLRISSQAKSSIFLHLGLLLTMIIIITYSIVQYTSLSIYSVPVASVAMLTMLLFN